MEEKKNKKIIIYIISVIVLVLIAGCIYLVLNNKNNSGNQTLPKDTTETLTVNEELAEELLTKIDGRIKEYYGKSIVYIKDVPMKLKIGYVVNFIDDEDSFLDENEYLTKTIDGEEITYWNRIKRERLKEKYEEFYYDDFVDVENGKDYYGCSEYLHHTNGYYYFSTHGCGYGLRTEKVSIKKVDNETIEIVAYIYDYDPEKEVVTDYTNNKVIMKDLHGNEDGFEFAEISDVKNHENEFQHYKFVFKLKNSNYTLYSVEPVK